MNDLPIVWPLSGGLLIGLAAAIHLLVNGRVAGVSGLTAAAAGLARGVSRTQGLGFIAGLLFGSLMAQAFIRRPEVIVTHSLPLLILAGVLVGLGTRLGSGCTSGHGVCGLARLSPRSVVATAIFMGSAMLTVLVMRQIGAGS